MVESESEKEDVYAGDDASLDADGDVLPDATQENADDEREDEFIKVNKLLRKEVGSQAFNYVTRLHKSLGHPSGETLLRMLEEVQATEAVNTAAKKYVCPTCYARRPPPPGVPPAAGLTVRNFGDRLVTDSAWIDTTEGCNCVLTLMDQATRHVAIRLLAHERADDFVKGVERAWIKRWGVPKYLRVDEAKGWASQRLRDWTSANGITLEVAPAECHN